MPAAPATRGKLAIHGGQPAVPVDLTFHTWPATDEQVEQFVFASLRQDKHASGPHVTMLRDAFAAAVPKVFKNLDKVPVAAQE